MSKGDVNLNGLFDRLLRKESYKKEEIIRLLELSDPVKIHQLFKAARQARDQVFGNRIFLYGFLYFSTYCRNNCRFCQYRKSNKELTRYRKSKEQILTAAKEMINSGVHLIDLTMGEDPAIYHSTENRFSELVDIVKAVRNKTKANIMISPGVVPDDVLENLSNAGAGWYACYQETHNLVLYRALRAGQAYQERLDKKFLARKLGMLIEEGILTGIGESTDDLFNSIIWMKKNDVDQARAMTFVPQPNTPMSEKLQQDSLKERIIISVMRLIMPELLIPASLDVDGLSGLKARLDAGANVVTSIVPPLNGLAGVANNSLDIEESRRTLEQISPVLTDCSLVPASQNEYSNWLKNRLEKQKIKSMKK